MVSRKYRAAHDHLLLEASAAKREHVDLGAVGPAVAVLDDAVRRHRDEDGAAQGRVQKQLLELVISVMPDLANELHGVSELLVLGVRQSDRDLLGDRVDLGSSEVIDKHLLDLSR